MHAALVQQWNEQLLRAGRTPGMEHLQTLVAEGMQQVNAYILQLAQSHVDLIPKIANHLTQSGGKRLRPVLTLASARLCGYQGTQDVALASAVEFLHTATLLHDDVVDGSNLRRGKPTANHAFGNKVSILVGDFLLGQAFKLMVASEHLEVLRILSHTAAVIAEGEVWQLASEHNLHLSEDQYRQVIQAKTACLFAAACEVSAVIANVTPEKQQALADFGMGLGMAFQMVDDALDYAADAQTLGKNQGDDFREGKVTLPILHLYQQLPDSDKPWLEQLFSPKTQRDDTALAQVTARMQQHGCVAYTLQQAQVAGHQALQALQTAFADATGDALEVRDALVETLLYSLRRTY